MSDHAEAHRMLLKAARLNNEECRRLHKGWKGYLPWRLMKVDKILKDTDRLLAAAREIERDWWAEIRTEAGDG